VIGALLLATALAGGTPAEAAPAPAAPAPTARWFRVVATAGPSFVRDDDVSRDPALALGTGLELGTNPWFRVTGRWEVHAARGDGISDHTTVVLFGVKLQHRPAGWPAWPYGFVGTGYGTAPSYSDFVLPAGAEIGGGVQFALPGGRECFLETARLGANERTFHCIRLGVLIP